MPSVRSSARPQLAVAVSGGPDSTALALLADAWAARARRLGPGADRRPRAATGIGGRGDAGRRWAWPKPASRRGSCVWSGAKPATGIQAAAREARYRLLEAACRTAGILHLLLGHQRDDQAETVAMRQATRQRSRRARRHGSGARGPGCRLLRPLLGVPKARLIATLTAAGRGWVVDPSNLSPALRPRPPAVRRRLRPAARWEASVHHAEAANRAGSGRSRTGWRRMCSRTRLGWARVDRRALANARPSGKGFCWAGCWRPSAATSIPVRERVTQRPRRSGAGGRNGCALDRRRLHRRRPRADT